MKTGPRIPTVISKFNTYINTSDDHNQSFRGGSQVYALLGMSAANATEWHNRRVFWRDTLYLKYSNPDTRTKTVNLEVKNFIRDFRAFANPQLDIMAASPNATAADEVIYNFKIDRAEPVHPETPIAEDCILGITALGQGNLRIRCRVSEDASRASVPLDAKGLELRYLIGDAPPLSVDDCPLSKTSTKALFTFSAGAANSGKKMFAYARWIDFSDDSRAGSWSAMVTVVIG
jgi:hypothetical protein